MLGVFHVVSADSRLPSWSSFSFFPLCHTTQIAKCRFDLGSHIAAKELCCSVRYGLDVLVFSLTKFLLCEERVWLVLYFPIPVTEPAVLL